jgi:uncharacterized protein (TIGR02301 family)
MTRQPSRIATVWISLFSALSLLSLSSPGVAQKAPPAAVPLPPELPPRPAPPPDKPAGAPFEADLARLAELMGTLTFMNELCGDAEGASAWREKMSALLDSEGRTGPRADRLTGSYNRGFRGYQFTYRTCTSAARAVIERSLVEGQTLTQALASRYTAP